MESPARKVKGSTMSAIHLALLQEISLQKEDDVEQKGKSQKSLVSSLHVHSKAEFSESLLF